MLDKHRMVLAGAHLTVVIRVKTAHPPSPVTAGVLHEGIVGGAHGPPSEDVPPDVIDGSAAVRLEHLGGGIRGGPLTLRQIGGRSGTGGQCGTASNTGRVGGG